MSDNERGVGEMSDNNEFDSFGPSTSSQRKEFLDCSEVSEDGDEVESGKGKQRLKDFLKPFSLNWKRECLMREGRVSMVYYLSPSIHKVWALDWLTSFGPPPPPTVGQFRGSGGHWLLILLKPLKSKT